MSASERYDGWRLEPIEELFIERARELEAPVRELRLACTACLAERVAASGRCAVCGGGSWAIDGREDS